MYKLVVVMYKLVVVMLVVQVGGCTSYLGSPDFRRSSRRFISHEIMRNEIMSQVKQLFLFAGDFTSKSSLG